jgi:hypothetical protein
MPRRSLLCAPAQAQIVRMKRCPLHILTGARATGLRLHSFSHARRKVFTLLHDSSATHNDRNDFVNLAARRIGFVGTFLRWSRNYYKVNDFKPAFAHLFPDLLHGYDLWGTIDNDILLGDVRGYVEKFLDDFDVIGGIPNHPTWGPFTMYRNVEHINQLFFKASLPMQIILGLPYAMFFDEWQEYGRLRKVPYATISGIIERNRDSVRVQQGLMGTEDPANDGPWGECGPDEQHPLPRCCECAYLTTTTTTRRSSSSSSAQPRLLHRFSLTGAYNDTLLCHYQKSKHVITRQMLEHPDLVDQLLGQEPGEFRVNAVDGLQPILEDDRSLLKTVHQDLFGN